MKVRTIPHARIKPRAAKCPAHLARVAGLPCLVCGRWPVHVHHVTGHAVRYGRLPRTDRRVAPLCDRHHSVQYGADSVHALGHRGFYEMHGIDLLAEAKRLEAESVELGLLEEV